MATKKTLVDNSSNVIYPVTRGECVVKSDGTTTLESAAIITMTTTDPGEGVSLAANNFIAVYEA